MAVTINIYDQAIEDIVSGAIDLDSDTLKVILLDTDASFTATNTDLTDISGDEIANGNGYTTGGATLSNVSVTDSAGTTTVDADDVTWTASGGNIAAFAAAIYDDTHANNRLIAFIDFGGEIIAGNGTNFNIVWNGSGILTVTTA